MRRSVVVHTNLAGHMLRAQFARRSENGVQVLTMGQLLARMAGGLLRPIDPDVLLETARAALSAVDLGELEPIKDLPGMPSAVAATFDKVWRADVQLSKSGHPRLAALARLEEEIVSRLPASMRRPSELVELASQRLELAKSVLGPVEIYGHSEMSPCWRPFLKFPSAPYAGIKLLLIAPILVGRSCLGLPASS